MYKIIVIEITLEDMKKKGIAYQMRPHLRELYFCHTHRPSTVYPESPN